MKDQRPQRYEQLVEAVREATPGPNEAQLERVLTGVRAELEEPRLRRLPGLVLVVPVVALAAAFAVWFSVRPSNELDAGLEPVWVAQLSGAVTAQGLENAEQLQRGGSLTFEAGAHGELEIGDLAGVAVQGPARLERPLAGPMLVADGHAAFAVRKRPPGSTFSVRAGDTTIVVRGTRFEVSVRDGRLVGFRVTEGAVQLTGPRAGRVKAGEGWGKTSTWSGPQLPTGRRDTTGVLEITASVAAKIEVDGLDRGTAPVIVRLPSGPHEVKLHAHGYLDLRREVVVVARQLQRVAEVLQPEASVEPPPPSPAAPSIRALERALRAGRCNEVDRLSRQVPRAGHTQALALRAECQLRAGHKQAALDLYLKVVEEGGTAAEAASFESAKLLAEFHRAPEALSSLDAYVAKYPRGQFLTEAAFRRCELLVTLRRAAEARRCLTDYVATWDGRARRGADALFLLAGLARVDRRWADAAELYGRYLDSGATANREAAAYYQFLALDHGALPGRNDARDRYLEQFPEGPHAGELSRQTP